MKQGENLKQIKNMIIKNKKIVIAIIILIILSLAIGITFASKPSDNKKAGSQTEQKIDVSKENDNKEDRDKKEEKESNKNNKNTDNANSTSTTKDNNKSSTDSNKKASSSYNSGSSGNSGNANSSSNTGSTGSSNKPSEPAHQHSWKQHTAQKWVSNIVTVPDYETQKGAVGTRYYFFYDGYTTTSDDDAKNHAMELILAGVDDGYRTEVIYEEKQIQVGSHQEDHGHNEDYVDYEYCDCGATR